MEKKLGFVGIFGIMLASSLTIMVGSAITPALPEIGVFFNMGKYGSWLVTVPALGVVIGALPCGKVMDKLGAYKTCVIGLLLYGLLGILGCMMPEKISEFADRFLLGIATALVMTSSTALISLFYEGEKRLKMIAIQGMAIELGGVIFLSVGGQMANISWRLPYFIYLIAFVAFVLLLLFVPNKKETIQESTQPTEEKRENHQKVLPVFLFAFLGMLIFFTAIVSLPSYLQNEKGYTAGFTGTYLASISLIAVIFAGFMPKVVKRFSAKTSLMIAYFCYACGQFCFYSSNKAWLLYIAAVLMGIGFGFSTPLVNNLTVERSTSKNKARNLSLYSMSTFLGQFLSSMIASIASGKNVFLAASMLACITFLLVAILFDRKKNPRSMETPMTQTV